MTDPAGETEGRRALLLGALALAASCAAHPSGTPEPTSAAGSEPGWSSSRQGAVQAASGLEVESWFPLIDGHVYQYRTSAEDGAAGMLVARVHRASDRVGELRTPSGTRRFEYRDEGLVTLREGAWVQVFRLPVGDGTWRGEHGGTSRWDAQNLRVMAPSGVHEGCARVVEERGGDRPARFATTFCPGVGVVVLEASSGGALERADLAYVGPPLDIGPDGTKRMP